MPSLSSYVEKGYPPEMNVSTDLTIMGKLIASPFQPN